MMWMRKTRMTMMGKVRRERMKTIPQKRLPKVRTRKGRMTMMTSESFTLTLLPPSIGLRASRLSETRRSLLW